MHRKTPPPDASLDNLLGERDHVRIQISLSDDEYSPRPGDVRLLRAKLADIEQRIAERRRARP